MEWLSECWGKNSRLNVSKIYFYFTIALEINRKEEFKNV